jgi:glucose-6-phosphate 1-dehydrogenase
MANSSACALVIFGASGDLAKLKLIPAVYELAREKLLPERFVLVGYSRTAMTDEQFRAHCEEAIRANARSKKTGIDPQIVERVLEVCFYQPGTYDTPDDFAALKTRLDDLDRQFATGGNRLFYLSTPPNTFVPIVQRLGAQQLVNKDATEAPWQRVIIEKPFGHDLPSAQRLNQLLLHELAEEQVFRIDHYLGKETVQNLMVMRFANSLFEPIWNYKYIDHVQITVAETVSADDRAGYYDKSGALRDMVQNHIFQLLSLIAMEPPAALDARHIRDEKVKVYNSMRPIRPGRVDDFAVRGQYGAGELNGKLTQGYRAARGVPEGSRTETFAALKVFIDNWRWSGTPFYIRTGKCLPEKLSEVVVRFRAPPQTLFAKQCDVIFPNDLIIKVAPEEGISLRLNGKVPGGSMNIKSVAMDFFYRQTFHKEAPEAYERLIHDAICGDQTLFIRGDEVEAAWQVIDPIEQGWAESEALPHLYTPGTWGPRAAMQLIELDGRRWMHSTGEVEAVTACAL